MSVDHVFPLSTTQAAPSLGDVVSGAALGVGLLTAWLYVAGWTYAYYFFDQFGIPLLMTELPREHFFVYGGLAVWKNLLVAAVAAVLVAILTVLAVRYRDRIGRGWLVGLSLAAIVAFFALARLAGIHTAYEDYATQRETDSWQFCCSACRASQWHRTRRRRHAGKN